MDNDEEKPSNLGQELMIAEMRAELKSKVEDTSVEGAKITKAQALVKHILTEAAKGDQRMLNHALKLIEKLGEIAENQVPAEESPNDWEGLFMFYGKYKTLIEEEIEKRRIADPYWSFDWCKPTLESAPWYTDLYKNKS